MVALGEHELYRSVKKSFSAFAVTINELVDRASKERMNSEQSDYCALRQLCSVR